MENTALAEVETLFKQKVNNVELQRKEVESHLAKLKETMESLKSKDGKSQSDLFVELKYGGQRIKSCLDTLKKSIDAHSTTITQLRMHETIAHVLSSSVSFGFLSEEPVLKCPFNCCEFHVRAIDDKATCNIRTVCPTREGNLILTDRENMKIKILNHDGELIDTLTVQGMVFGACDINVDKFAITILDKKLEQVVTKNPLTVRNEFQVGERCRGIAHYAGQLFVCCGGSVDFGEGPGRIEVYDMEGSFLKKYDDNIGCPWYIHISDEGSKLFFSEMFRMQIKQLDMFSGATSSWYDSRPSDGPAGMCSIDFGQHLLISGNKSNKIVLLSTGRKAQVLLSEKEGIIKPRAVAFDKKYCRLLVSLESSDTIKVFSFIC